MNTDVENVKQAKESFNRILNNKKNAGIIKDENHLSEKKIFLTCHFKFLTA